MHLLASPIGIVQPLAAVESTPVSPIELLASVESCNVALSGLPLFVPSVLLVMKGFTGFLHWNAHFPPVDTFATHITGTAAHDPIRTFLLFALFRFCRRLLP